MMQTTMIHQELQTLCYAVIFGAMLGPVYDFFRILRIAGLRQKLPVLLQDILFLLIFMIGAFFFFVEYTDGYFRSFVVAGAVFGFLLYYFTVGKIVIGAADLILSAVKKTAFFLWKKLLHPLGLFFSQSAQYFRRKIGLFIQKFQKQV